MVGRRLSRLYSQRASEPVARTALGADHVHDGVDQSQVRERLREVAEVAAAPGVDLFGVELQRARIREQLLAQLPRARDLTDLAKRRHHPERADRERALFARQAVVGFLGAVPQAHASSVSSSAIASTVALTRGSS